MFLGVEPPAAIVLGRMSSSRLPGKVLQNLRDRPLLAYPIERLRHSGCVGAVVVATSTDSSDDPIEDYCNRTGVACFRGDLDNVARRTLDAARSVDAEWFFRANADSPFLAVELYESAIRQRSDADLVSNVFPRFSHPVLRLSSSGPNRSRDASTSSLRAMRSTSRSSSTGIPRRCRIVSLDGGFVPFRDGLRLVVDDGADQERARRVLDRMTRPHWEYGLQEVMDLMAEVDVQ